MQKTTTQTPVILKWQCKKFRILDNLRALHLELVFLMSRGKLTRERELKAIRQSRTQMALINYYKKRYNFYINNSN